VLYVRHARGCLVTKSLWAKMFGTKTTHIMTKHTLMTKLIPRMDHKSKDKFIKSINLLLEIVHCSAMLSNHGIIKL
jgi:hypothetical protein